MHHVLAPIGELGGSCLSGVLLVFLFVAVFTSILTLCACMNAPNASMPCPGLLGSCGRDFALPPGKYGVFGSFWGF